MTVGPLLSFSLAHSPTRTPGQGPLKPSCSGTPVSRGRQRAQPSGVPDMPLLCVFTDRARRLPAQEGAGLAAGPGKALPHSCPTWTPSPASGREERPVRCECPSPPQLRGVGSGRLSFVDEGRGLPLPRVFGGRPVLQTYLSRGLQRFPGDCSKSWSGQLCVRLNQGSGQRRGLSHC